MANIDDKVVAMSFESSKFEAGVNDVIRALDKLKASLKFPDSGKGLNDINAAAKRVDLSHISRGVDEIKNKLGFMSVAALAAFASIATKAISTGVSIAKAFTLDPLKAGFQEYSTNLNAVQTILANTAASGATLKDVNAALLELNKYSDKTIYNFSQMAKNIGTFTAAGVDLDTATSAIKGIANLAALSGSTADQASTAMYQLSQALAAGRVTLMDWNSVVNAGMGGTVFQRALAQTAVSMGTLKENSLKLVGPMKNVSISGESFRNSLAAAPGKTSWLTSDVLTKTLNHFTGDLTDAQLAAEGFSKADIMAIQQQAKLATNAATQVKTLSQVLDVAKETAGSGWAQTWQIIFGDFGEAKTTFTALSNTINGFINANSAARNKVLQDWKDLGGRTVLIDGIRIAFHNLGAILAPIRDAFREIFPATTGRDLFNLTKQFKAFAEALKPSPQTVDNLKRTFAGLFAILDIGRQIVSGIFTVFRTMFGALKTGDGGFLSFTATVGDFFVALDKALKKGEGLNKFFVGLGNVLAAPLKIIASLAGAIGTLFSGFSPGGFSGEMTGLTRAMTPLEKVMTGMANAWDNLMDSFDGSGALETVAELLGKFGTALGDAASNMNFDAILAAIRTGLFAGLVVMFKQFLGRGSFLDQIGKGFGGGIIANISGSFKALQGSMTAMQNNLRAKTLKEIAIAIALLAASVVALSFVKPERLNAALGAMTIMFGELIGAMALLDKLSTTGGFLKLPFIVASLIGLAAAIDLLTVAVIAMSLLSWDELVRGLGGVAVLLVGISKASGPLSANSAGLIKASAGIFILAAALNLMALAVRQFGSLSFSELAKGLAAVAISLTLFTTAMNRMPESAVAIRSSLGIIALAVALKILASAVTQLSKLSWEEMARGLSGIAVTLTAIVLAMKFMPENIGRQAAGLLIIAVALRVLSEAIVQMGGLSPQQLATGLIALGGALLILVKGLNAMSGSLRGAAALTIVAAGLSLLAPALVLLGKQSWENIAKGLISLGGALVIIGLAGNLLGSASLAFLAFGAAVTLVGAGIALAGAGFFLFAAGLSAVAVAAPTAIGIIIAAFKEWLNAIPEIAASFALGALSIVQAFAKTAPMFVDAMVKIIESLIEVIIRSAPKIAEAATVLIQMFLQVLRDNQADIIQAGFALLLALLDGIRQNIAQVTTSVVTIITTFLTSLASNLGRIITAGANVLISLLKGIANNLSRVTTAALSIVTAFLNAIANNLTRIVTSGIGIITKLIEGISKSLNKLVTAGANAIVSFLEGVGKNGPRIVTAGTDALIKLMNALSSNSVKLADAGAKAIIRFLNGVADAIRDNEGDMLVAGARIGVAIVQGMINGMGSIAQNLYNKAEEIAGKALSILKKPWKVFSPSKVTHELGTNIIQGMINGLDATAPQAYASAAAMSNGLIDSFKNTFQISSPSKVMQQIGQFVGQGFAEGLRGSSDDIRSSFTELNQKLTEAMTTARETIASEQEKLDKLRASKKPDAEAIAAAQKIINENEAILARSSAAHKVLVTTLKSEKNELIGLSNEYNRISEKLKLAKDALDAAVKTRNDAVNSFTDQYSTLPDIVKTDAEGNAIDQLAAYEEALKHQTDAVGAYQSTLQQLRKLGLDDATYQKLLSEGTADQEFANQLLAGGRTAVQGLNKLDTQLMTVSKTLATNAAKNLYQAGVDAAEGLVKGLQAKRSAIRKEMEEIAREMLRALRKELGIKSPSQEFAEIGRFSMEGLAKGFSDASGLISSAMDKAATDALNTMKSSIRGISDFISAELNTSPVITPILDLTQAKAQVGELASITDVTPITTSASLGRASAISAITQTNSEEEARTSEAVRSVIFEQNNYSPEALSEIEIYRQTRNQISQLKSALALT